MKIGVFAGTFVDTKMGEEILRERGFETLSFPISKNPKDQSLLQYYSREELTNIVEEKISEQKIVEPKKFLSTAILFLLQLI